jgi:hypothetical protein
MSFSSYSQAGQDRWAFETLKELQGGHYLDIGANHPVIISNTYALETQKGWDGFMVENDPNCFADLRQQRKGFVIAADATTFDYSSLARHDFDYLSLDVDAASLDALRKLLAGGITFRCATVEHDFYRFGDIQRAPMREILSAAGYTLTRPDVCNPESPTMPYEDWWVDPKRT